MIIDDIDCNLEVEQDEPGGEESFRPKDPEQTEDDGDVDHTDLLKLYIREASRSSMLTAEGEVAGAKRIECARNRLAKLLSRSPVVGEYCIHLKQTFRDGKETAADVIEQAAATNSLKPLPISELADPALAE